MVEFDYGCEAGKGSQWHTIPTEHEWGLLCCICRVTGRGAPGRPTQGAILPHVCQLRTLVLAQLHLSSSHTWPGAPSLLFVKEPGQVIPLVRNESSW